MAPSLAPAVSANRNNNRYVGVWHDVQPGGNFNDIYGRLVNSSTEPSSNLLRVNSFDCPVSGSSVERGLGGAGNA